MKTYIEIHDNNTNVTGTYQIWFKHNGEKHRVILSEDETDGLLNIPQKEDFFVGEKNRFLVSPSIYDGLCKKLTL